MFTAVPSRLCCPPAVMRPTAQFVVPKSMPIFTPVVTVIRPPPLPVVRAAAAAVVLSLAPATVAATCGAGNRRQPPCGMPFDHSGLFQPSVGRDPAGFAAAGPVGPSSVPAADPLCALRGFLHRSGSG